MPSPRFIIGIDLGTTNSAVAYVDTKGRERPTADIKPFDVPQLVAAGETAPRPMLPSFLYLPGPHELPTGSGDTPWAEGSDRIVGECQERINNLPSDLPLRRARYDRLCDTIVKPFLTRPVEGG